MVNGIQEYEFQNDCVDYLVEKTAVTSSKKVITVKAPTGAGKTVILIKYIDTFLKNTNEKTAFIWFCPGKGNLEEQSREKMESLMPQLDARTLVYSMISGFEPDSVTFINWELVNKKSKSGGKGSTNVVLRESEKASLFDRIDEAHRNGVKFIIIVDEEHSNDTPTSNEILDAFDYKKLIRVSATTHDITPFEEFYEIDENEVINSGLITRAIYVNEGLVDNMEYTNDYDCLIDLADQKRQEIRDHFESIGVNIYPLVLIQFPSARPEVVEAVEEKLRSMNYTYENGMVAKWFSDTSDKINIEDITKNDSKQSFLLCKQAITTGWDCPCAKILVKLREGGNEDFNTQTIGRIRRMPEHKHYLFPSDLDYCYVYTLDEQYKKGLLSSPNRAYQVRSLFIKNEAKDTILTKEMRNLDIDSGIGERELLEMLYNHLIEKYNLDKKDKKINEDQLRIGGYIFSHEVDSKVIQGEFATIGELASVSENKKILVKATVNTHTHGLYLMHTTDELKKIASVSSNKVRNILQRLFRKSKGKYKRCKLLSLETNDFYAFVINNAQKLKEEFREIVSGKGVQLSFIENAKTIDFKIPESEIYKFSYVKDIELMEKNVYKEYTNEFITEKTRSLPERLFERYCNENANVDWYYKNGDKGQQYLSIVYIDGIKKQCLFYPDYIVKMNNGDIWILETKGGMANGNSKNIDMHVEVKFNALKEYARKHNIKWGFVRDMEEKLYICNTDYTDKMNGDNWKALDKEF